MANEPTVQCIATWTDAFGRLVRHEFNVKYRETLTGNIDIEGIRSDALSVMIKMDAVSDAQLLNLLVLVPIGFGTSGYKASAEAESSSRRGAVAFFTGAAGENLRSERVSNLVPDPKETYLDFGQRVIRLKVGDPDVTSYIDAFKAKARTTYGELIADYDSSIFRQRSINKRSKQSA